MPNVCSCVMSQIKCYQYWPCGEEHGHVGQLEFGNFRIYYRQELRNEYFTIRSLELENISVSRKHIATWQGIGLEIQGKVVQNPD